MGRPKDHGPLIEGFTVNFYEEDRSLLDGFHNLCATERLDKGAFTKKALEEYVTRHSPGNNQLILDNYQENPVPFSVAAQEKLTRQVEEARGKRVECPCEKRENCSMCGGKGFYFEQ